MERIKQVLWDWNGTLLDDLQYGIDVRNRVFPAFGLPGIEKADYYEQFTFPIRLYYERGGVTEETFDAVAHAWMDEYMRNCAAVPLHPDALETLERFRQAGLTQVILSASSLELLKKQLAYYPLAGCFDEVLGLSDIYANSKEAIGLAYLSQCGVSPQNTIMIGDTLHDAEVARAMGVRCVLVSRGHQSERRLLGAGVPVLDSLKKAAELILSA